MKERTFAGPRVKPPHQTLQSASRATSQTFSSPSEKSRSLTAQLHSQLVITISSHYHRAPGARLKCCSQGLSALEMHNDLVKMWPSKGGCEANLILKAVMFR